MRFHISLSLDPFEWVVHELPSSPHRIPQQSTDDSLLLGKIYGEHSPFSQKHKVGSLEGRFVLIRFEPLKKEVQIFVDNYRLLNTFYFFYKGRLHLSNSLAAIPPELREPDDIGTACLKQWGVVPYPLTLFKSVQFLPGNATWSEGTKLHCKDQALNWPDESYSPELYQWDSAFHRSVAQIVQNWNPVSFRVSGGVDTRLITLALTSAQRQSLQWQVLRHPLLTENEDRDVLGARTLSKVYQTELKVLSPSKKDFNYVFDREGPPLSGLYGGELLGGVAQEFSPIGDPDIFFQETSDDPFFHWWKQRWSSLGGRKFLLELYLSSFRSTIYKSVRHSWASPWHLNLHCLSPFVEKPMLDLILKTPWSELENYQLYVKLFKRMAGDIAQLPLSSPIVGWQEGLTAFSQGTDPKSLGSPTEETEFLQLGETNLQEFLKSLT